MSSQKKLKFAIIGTGNRGVHCFGQMLIKRQDCEIVALVDPNHVRSAHAAEILNIKPMFFHDVEEMLKSVTPDAVVITSPDFTHCANAIAALKGGCNVLLDKPLATHVSDCQDIIEVAEKCSKILMMGFNLRHNPVLKKLKSIIDEGTAGKIFMIENREFYNGGRTYMARWNGDYAKSGGLWIHKGSHDFDVFQWLMNFPKPVRVSSFSSLSVLDPNHLPFALRPGVEAGPNCRKCPYRTECPDAYPEGTEIKLFGEDAIAVDGYIKDKCIYLSEKSVHDNGMAIVEYDNGARAVHSECFIGPINDRKYTVWGELATIEVSLTNREIIVHPRWSDDIVTYKIAEAQGGHGGADPMLLDTFVKAVQHGDSSTSTAEHGMWSTACGEAAERSWREHRTVEVQELFK